MRLFVLFLSYWLALPLMAQSDVTQALWVGATPVIDGNNNEWKRPFGLYDGSTGIMFSVANDSANLYLCFTVNEEWKAKKMLNAGWEVEISCKEKNKKASGLVKISGQKSDEPEKGIREYGWGQRPDFSPFVNAYRLQFATVELQRFLSGNGFRPFNDTAGVQVNLQADSIQGMVIEMAIPLDMLIDKGILNLNEQLQLQVIVNGVSIPTTNNTQAPDPNGGWDNSNNRGSVVNSQMNNGYGDMTGRPDAGNTQNTQYPPTYRSPLTEQASFKQKFKLAAKY